MTQAPVELRPSRKYGAVAVGPRLGKSMPATNFEDNDTIILAHLLMLQSYASRQSLRARLRAPSIKRTYMIRARHSDVNRSRTGDVHVFVGSRCIPPPLVGSLPAPTPCTAESSIHPWRLEASTVVRQQPGPLPFFVGPVDHCGRFFAAHGRRRRAAMLLLRNPRPWPRRPVLRCSD
jgi:hypothetical protein